MAYEYTPINARTQIRLLDLSLENGDDTSAQIHCRLQVDTRNQPGRKYQAVSYTWGDPALKKTIRCGVKTLAVTENCHQALADLRKIRHAASLRAGAAPALPLWIDAICIDQNNVAERSAQVAIMGDIFRSATFTIVWLGEDDDQSAEDLMGEAARFLKVPNSPHATQIALTLTESIKRMPKDPWEEADEIEHSTGRVHRIWNDMDKKEKGPRRPGSADEVSIRADDADYRFRVICHIEDKRPYLIGKLSDRLNGVHPDDKRKKLVSKLCMSLEYWESYESDYGILRLANSLRQACADHDPVRELALRFWTMAEACSRKADSVLASHRGEREREETREDIYTSWLSPLWQSFFERPWFTRRWVVQEVLLSQRLGVLVGGKTFPWKLVVAAGNMLTNAARYRPDPRNHQDSDSSLSDISSGELLQPDDHKPRGAALLVRLEVLKPLAVHEVEKCWPVVWLHSRVNVDNMLLPDGTRRTTVTARPKAKDEAPFAATKLCKLLEDSADLQCSDPRDRIFALLGLFDGQAPQDLTVDYDKRKYDIFCDLSFFLLSHGSFAILSFATFRRSHAYPSWAVDWTNHYREHHMIFNRKFRIPSNLHDHPKGFTSTVKRCGNAIALCGRVLFDPIKDAFELHPGDETTLRIRTESGVWSLATGGARGGDVLCLFACCDRAFVLRIRDPHGWYIVAQSRLGSSTLDWSGIVFKAEQSDIEDIWIY